MLDALRTPLRPGQALLAACLVVCAVTLYCLTYTALAGDREPAGRAAAWALVNVLPWLAALELGKRSGSVGLRAAAIGAAFALSMAGQLMLDGRWNASAFELARRVPAMLVTGFLLFGSLWLDKRRRVPSQPGLPLAPSQLDWVRAAGNYVELHAGGRTILHRAPLSRVEAQLSSRDFVRVHRSILVRRDRIARVRPQDVVLHDGTSLRTGSRYRALLHS